MKPTVLYYSKRGAVPRRAVVGGYSLAGQLQKRGKAENFAVQAGWSSACLTTVMARIDPTEQEDEKNALVNPVPSEMDDLEDMPAEMDAEDIIIEGRKPDLGEIEDDTSEL